MNFEARSRHLRWLFFLLLLLVPARLLHFLWTARPQLLEHPYNARLAERVEWRGRILDRKGNVLAVSREQRRQLTEGRLVCHWVGYHSLRLGLSSGERWRDSILKARRGLDLGLSQQEARGRDVRLSLDLELQRKLNAGFLPRLGAGLLFDLESGQILAALSRPDFDPSRVEVEWQSWQQHPQAPTLSRFGLGLYPAGGLWTVWEAEFLGQSRTRKLMDWTPPLHLDGSWLVSPVQVAGCLLGNPWALSQLHSEHRVPWVPGAAVERLPWKPSPQGRTLSLQAQHGNQVVSWGLALRPPLAAVFLDEEGKSADLGHQALRLLVSLQD